MTDCSEGDINRLRDKMHELEVDVARLQEQEKASDRALIIAADALRHAQATSNEWRKENLDQRALFPTTNKVDGQFTTEASERRALEARVVLLEKAGNAGQARSSAFGDVWVKFVAIAGLLLAGLSFFYNKLIGK
jgi:hypothetical protein